LAEVIKYGVIYDAAFFDRFEHEMPKILARDPEVLTAVIARCCEIKADVVRQDETEGGMRAILNFGHTVGHAIEAVAGYGKYLHGEAVSMGSVAAARLSCRVLGMPEAQAERMETLFKEAGLPTGLRLSKRQIDRIMDAMKLDKKASGGEVKFVLAREIGQVEFGRKVPGELVLESVRELSENT
jgi:3-dehydroquinate synthase